MTKTAKPPVTQLNSVDDENGCCGMCLGSWLTAVGTVNAADLSAGTEPMMWKKNEPPKITNDVLMMYLIVTLTDESPETKPIWRST